jgi:hypothetical protein
VVINKTIVSFIFLIQAIFINIKNLFVISITLSFFRIRSTTLRLRLIRASTTSSIITLITALGRRI